MSEVGFHFVCGFTLAHHIRPSSLFGLVVAQLIGSGTGRFVGEIAKAGGDITKGVDLGFDIDSISTMAPAWAPVSLSWKRPRTSWIIFTFTEV